MKWMIASLALVSLPLSAWLSAKSASVDAYRIYIPLGLGPVVAGLLVELWQQRKLAKTYPERYQEGSALGNKVALFVAAAILICITWGVYRVLVSPG